MPTPPPFLKRVVFCPSINISSRLNWTLCILLNSAMPHQLSKTHSSKTITETLILIWEILTITRPFARTEPLKKYPFTPLQRHGLIWTSNITKSLFKLHLKITSLTRDNTITNSFLNLPLPKSISSLQNKPFTNLGARQVTLTHDLYSNTSRVGLVLATSLLVPLTPLLVEIVSIISPWQVLGTWM